MFIGKLTGPLTDSVLLVYLRTLHLSAQSFPISLRSCSTEHSVYILGRTSIERYQSIKVMCRAYWQRISTPEAVDQSIKAPEKRSDIILCGGKLTSGWSTAGSELDMI